MKLPVRKRSSLFGMVNDIPLNTKFLYIYFFCVLLPIIVINGLFFDRISQSIRTREQQNLEISMERAVKDIYGIIEGGVAIAQTIYTDRILYEILDKPYDSQLDFYEAYTSLMQSKVSHYIPVNSQIQQISVFTDNGTIQSGGNYFRLSPANKESAWYRMFSSTPDKVSVLAYKESDPNDYMMPNISIVENMEAYDDTKEYAKILKIDINLNKIYDIIIREKDYFRFYLVNGDRIVLSEDVGFQLDKSEEYPPFDLDTKPVGGVVFDRPLGSASYMKGWRLVGIADNERTSSALRENGIFIFLLAGASTLLTSVLIYVMLRSYNYRVKKLSRHMERVKNEKFDLLVLDEGRDEIGELIRNFNRMTAKINSLINDVYKLEIQKKDLELERVRAELNFLQSQMNPHFLFNTLNAILVVCTRNQYNDVTEIIKYLSKILRRLLSWKEDIVTLEEEMLFTDMYLKIEKFRFGDKFEYHFDIKEEALSCKMPKMSIQPLVENACKHGLQTVKGGGLIKLSAEVTDSLLRVRIEDNGKGMDAGTLSELIDNMKQDSAPDANIGIRNVYRRLELYYGDRVRFDIASSPHGGTRIFFEIPLIGLPAQAEGGEPRV